MTCPVNINEKKLLTEKSFSHLYIYRFSKVGNTTIKYAISAVTGFEVSYFGRVDHMDSRGVGLNGRLRYMYFFYWNHYNKM